jgi:hypothetical protein
LKRIYGKKSIHGLPNGNGRGNRERHERGTTLARDKMFSCTNMGRGIVVSLAVTLLSNIMGMMTGGYSIWNLFLDHSMRNLLKKISFGIST